MLSDASFDIRPWSSGDREAAQQLLRLFSAEAEISSGDAPTDVAVENEHVVGMVTLCVYRTLTGPKAYLDHLVVDPQHRRRGFERALAQHAIARAHAAGASRVDLTAGDQKIAGRALYRSLGFAERDTRVFRLEL